jgi:hypothetical protein
VFGPFGRIIFGLDETCKRRRDDKMKAKGLYRDPVRSSCAYVVNVSGLRRLCRMPLTPVRWGNWGWALPLMTLLCRAERFDELRGRRSQTLVPLAWQMIHVVVGWRHGRVVVLVADSRDVASEWRHRVSPWPRARLITRRRLDAALDGPLIMITQVFMMSRSVYILGCPRGRMAGSAGQGRRSMNATMLTGRLFWRRISVPPWR